MEGEQEVEETIEEVDEDNDKEEEMKYDIETDEDENDTSTDLSKEEEEMPCEVKNNTQAKGMKRTIVNEGHSIDLGTSVVRALAIVENVVKREVHVPETQDRIVEHVDIGW